MIRGLRAGSSRQRGAGAARTPGPRESRGGAVARRPARPSGNSDQFPKTRGGMLLTTLTPSLSPSDGERLAEGRVRGLPGNPLVVIGKLYQAAAGTIDRKRTRLNSSH